MLSEPTLAAHAMHGMHRNTWPNPGIASIQWLAALQAVESHIYSEALDTGDGSVRFAGFVVDQV